MSSFKLYGFFYSSASWRVRIAMALKDIPHDSSFVNLSSGMQYSPEYSAINPG